MSKDGGPAFPVGVAMFSGMSLRDYLAAKVMQGELASMTNSETEDYGLSVRISDDDLKVLTKHWVRIADALLEELGK